MQVNGDLGNIKTYLLKELEDLYTLSVPIGQLSTHELNERMLAITDILDREVAVYMNRQGKIVQVSLGDADTVDLPEVQRQEIVARPGVHDRQLVLELGVVDFKLLEAPIFD